MAERISPPLTEEQIANAQAILEKNQPVLFGLEMQYVTQSLALNITQLQELQKEVPEIVEDAQTIAELMQWFYPEDFWPYLEDWSMNVLTALKVLSHPSRWDMPTRKKTPEKEEQIIRLSKKYPTPSNDQEKDELLKTDPRIKLLNGVYQAAVNTQYWERRHSELVEKQKG